MRARFSVKSPRFYSFFGACLVFSMSIFGCEASVYDLVGRGDLEKLEQRLHDEPDLVHSRNALGKTSLHYAVTYRQPKALALLISNGAEVNVKDETGLMPLHVAAILNRIDEAQLLLDAGAEVAARDDFGDTPLHSAALHGNREMLEFLLRHGADALARNVKGKTPRDLALAHRKGDLANFLEAVERGLREH